MRSARLYRGTDTNIVAYGHRSIANADVHLAVKRARTDAYGWSNGTGVNCLNGAIDGGEVDTLPWLIANGAAEESSIVVSVRRGVTVSTKP